MSDVTIEMSPVKRLAKLLAEMHYYYAKELIARLGPDEGKAAVRHALGQMAASRIAAMQRDAAAHGLSTTGMAAYKAIKDFPTEGWVRDDKGVVSYCPMAETWKSHGDDGLDIGGLYCEIDYLLYDGFGIALERPECLGNGDNCCRFQPKER